LKNCAESGAKETKLDNHVQPTKRRRVLKGVHFPPALFEPPPKKQGERTLPERGKRWENKSEYGLGGRKTTFSELSRKKNKGTFLLAEGDIAKGMVSFEPHNHPASGVTGSREIPSVLPD